MPGRLTTHVLDTAQGRPAAGVVIELWRLNADGSQGDRLVSVRTNADGRTEAPLLAGPDFRPGFYELVFHTGAYFAGQQLPLADPPFLDQIPVRFSVAAAGASYHVPLLVSPWAYSTYCGS